MTLVTLSACVLSCLQKGYLKLSDLDLHPSMRHSALMLGPTLFVTLLGGFLTTPQGPSEEGIERHLDGMQVYTMAERAGYIL